MIGTEEENNEIMRMNAASMICDKIKGLKFKSVSEDFIRLCSSENRQTGVKCVVTQNKVQNSARFNRSNYHLQKNYVQYMNIKKKY